MNPEEICEIIVVPFGVCLCVSVHLYVCKSAAISPINIRRIIMKLRVETPALMPSLCDNK